MSQRATESLNAEDTAQWTRLADGYVVCAYCVCLVHPTTVRYHKDVCAVRARIAEGQAKKDGP